MTITKAVPTGEMIASGTFSSIIELKISESGERVAGKVFKINPSDTEQLKTKIDVIIKKITIITRLRHVNIVESKGVCFLPDRILPVLLMERMTLSLQSYIQYHNFSLSMEQIIGILQGTASGLSYFHSLHPPFIHGHLTSDAVLLDKKLKAKIGGFGIASVPHLPLNTSYMPPEVQEGTLPSETSLDVFSFGHLALYTVLQEDVGPLLPSQYINEVGKQSIRGEVDRRASSVKEAEQILSNNQSLLEVIKDCLSNNPTQRPSATQLVRKIPLTSKLLYRNSERMKYKYILQQLQMVMKVDQVMRTTMKT